MTLKGRRRRRGLFPGGLVWLAGWVGGAGLGAAVAPPPLPPPAARQVDFVTDIRPILSHTCYQCHGPDKQKSGFRLDVKSVALKGGEHGKDILPGRSEESRLIRFVGGLDEDIQMPPRKPGLKRLTREEIGLLRAWIDQGAVWPDGIDQVKLEDKSDWWSLKPLERPPVPAVQENQAGWVRNPIDAFILAKLEGKGLSPSPEADRRTLIRRVYFDLTGLPPAPEAVDAFVANPDPQAYEKLVDTLLDSPRFGERWARHWLDVVHYGDTHGYDKDKPRPHAWPYRDYVIRAFNTDKPYGRFVQEQIAGDVLFPGTADGIVALGFIAAGPWDFIGHAEVPESKTDGKIARHLDRDDMVANTINTFSSLTIHCAQCHNHKFDPITQEDYYSLQAVFAAVDRADRAYDADPAVAQKRHELKEREAKWAAQKKELEAKTVQLGGAELAALDKKIETLSQAAAGAKRPEYGYHSGIVSKQDTLKWVQVDLGRTVAVDRILLAPCYDDFNNIKAGFGFPLRYKVEIGADPGFQSGVKTVVDHTGADVPNPGIVPQTIPAAGQSGRYVRMTATKLAPRQNDYIFALSELEVYDASGVNVAHKTTVTSLDSIEAPVRWARHNLVDGIYPGASVPSGQESLASLRAQREALLERVLDPETRRGLAEADQRLASLGEEMKALPAPSLVYVGSIYNGSGAFRGTGPDGGKPREIHVLYRGDVANPGPLVRPGAIAAVKGLKARFEIPPDAPEGERRAALAHWLTDRRNPLTWRSIVNRLWLYHFGRGIVDSPNDFGRMGQLPTHPELLDWLAVELRDGGESLKRIHRLIVTSATYRQVSSTSEDSASGPGSAARARAERIDSNNAYLWRMNRRRLEAEAIRDTVLWVSGKLDERMYGPGFQDFVIEKPEHSPHYEYDLHDPEDPQSHRRAIYRFIVRSQQEPFMTTLDCADPSVLVDKRGESLSALQALALLNNSFMLCMSKHFAEKLDQDGGSLPEKIERGFRRALNRRPAAEEKQMLVDYARQFGLANACRVLFNLNEFTFVD
jgi:mono/diheme cytochrome c family protein